MTANNFNLEPSNDSSNSSPWESLADVPFAGDTLNTDTDNAPTIITKSPNRTCNAYLREIQRQGNMKNIESFLESTLNHEPYRFDSESALNQFCETYSNQLSSTLSDEEKSALKNYSGFNYKTINQVARGQWDYNLLGDQTPEKIDDAEQSISQISQAISTAPNVDTDLVTFRGTNLDSFHGYNISSLSDLNNLKNQFFFEAGYTSTSLSPNKSFTNQEFDDPLRSACDITIEYTLPANNNETIGLLSQETSYSPTQREVLIDKGSLSYISDVEVSPDQTEAKLKMVLVPRQVYDQYS